MELDRYYKMKDIADIFSGYTRAFLRNKSDKEKPLNVKQVKIINWQEVKEFTSGISKGDTLELVNFHRTYDKKIRFMQKGDILFPVKSGMDNTEIILIEEEPKEKIIYDSTIFVIKITELTVDPRYIYIMLNSDAIKLTLKKTAWIRANTRRRNLPERKTLGINLVPRLTAEILKSIRIIKLTEEERHKIVEEYNKINKAQEDFNNKLNRLQTQRKEM